MPFLVQVKPSCIFFMDCLLSSFTVKVVSGDGLRSSYFLFVLLSLEAPVSPACLACSSRKKKRKVLWLNGMCTYYYIHITFTQVHTCWSPNEILLRLLISSQQKLLWGRLVGKPVEDGNANVNRKHGSKITLQILGGIHMQCERGKSIQIKYNCISLA